MTVVAESPNGHAVLEPGRTPDVVYAEKAVLGSMIASRKAAEAVLEILTAEDCFGVAEHRAVYAAVRHLAENGELRGEERIDHPAVLRYLVATEHGVWRTGQAALILGDLAAHATPSYGQHVQTLLNETTRRRGLHGLNQARQILTDPAFDPAASGDMIRELIDDALTAQAPSGDLVTAGDLFTSAIERLEAGRPPGVIQPPWLDLRDLVPYLRPGQLVTFAARPSLGKSLLAQDLARYVGIHKQIPVILFTMEMDRDEVMDRFLAAESSVLLKRIIDGTLDETEWSRVAATSERFADSKLVIDDTPQITLAHIRARLRGMARRDPAQIAIIDYLQLMLPPAGENRQREVSAVVSGLKAVAREFRIPVVMLCQLNRGPESRHDKRPFMADARESGAVENDSDIAVLIHRPDFHEQESPRAGEADLIVDKNRNGPRGTATVGFQGHYGRFVDLTWTPTSSAGELND
jgi:replicative DNA helicase